MKKWYYIFFAVFLFVGGLFSANAQDLIVLRDGNIIEVRVVEISQTEIRYRRFDHLDGPIIVIPTINVLSIRYENGRVEILNSALTSPPVNVTTQRDPRSINIGVRDHYLSGSIGAFGVGLSLGLNYERMFERVSWGVDLFIAEGMHSAAFAGAATFKFFPVHIFFLGADLGLSYWMGRGWQSFGLSLAPQFGLRLGGQNKAFFTDIFVAAPIHAGTGGFDINVRPGTRIGGAW